MALFYVVAGINHFLHPEMYVSIMSRFLPASSYRPLVAISGIFEAVFGLLIPTTKDLHYWKKKQLTEKPSNTMT
jgi:uncharacterized membrane protein